jgi:hypothetical protein
LSALPRARQFTATARMPPRSPFRIKKQVRAFISPVAEFRPRTGGLIGIDVRRPRSKAHRCRANGSGERSMRRPKTRNRDCGENASAHRQHAVLKYARQLTCRTTPLEACRSKDAHLGRMRPRTNVETGFTASAALHLVTEGDRACGTLRISMPRRRGGAEGRDLDSTGDCHEDALQADR